MSRKLRALAGAIVLTLAIPAAALAATSSSSMTVDATINSTIALTGVPASYTLGAGIPGDTLTGAAFSLSVSSSEPSYTLTVASDGLVSGGNSIPLTNLAVVNDGTPTAFPATPGSALNLPVGNGVSRRLALTVPPLTASGIYTTTLTWTASN